MHANRMSRGVPRTPGVTPFGLVASAPVLCLVLRQACTSTNDGLRRPRPVSGPGLAPLVRIPRLGRVGSEGVGRCGGLLTFLVPGPIDPVFCCTRVQSFRLPCCGCNRTGVIRPGRPPEAPDVPMLRAAGTSHCHVRCIFGRALTSWGLAPKPRIPGPPLWRLPGGRRFAAVAPLPVGARQPLSPP